MVGRLRGSGTLSSALKALSPAVNDPTTAVTCVNYLGAILAKPARRGMSPPQREVNGVVRVIAPAPRLADFVDHAISEIHRHATEKPRVLLAELQALRAIVESTDRPDRLQAIEHHLQRIEQAAGEQPEQEGERISEECAQLRAGLAQEGTFARLAQRS